MTSSVYFLASKNASVVKIGCSEDVGKRTTTLQSSSSDRVQLLKHLPGDERLEQALHKRFATYRIRGEWFRHTGALATFIRLIPTGIDEDNGHSLARERRERKRESLQAIQPKRVADVLAGLLDILLDVRDLVGGGEIANAFGVDRSDLARMLRPGAGRHMRLDVLLAIGRVARPHQQAEILAAIAAFWTEVSETRSPDSEIGGRR